MTMTCPKCRGENPEGALRCVHCGWDLRAAPSAGEGAAISSTGSADGLERLIPSKNVPALVGYYLGVFSVIPGIGIFIGIPAFVLGILGLKRAKANPAVRGKAHAWTGIIMGGLFGFGYLILAIVPLTLAVLTTLRR